MSGREDPQRIVALDGLRAFAVIAVIWFHSGHMLKGGFVGVDIFFVLSGFLITSILERELSGEGKINLPRFYLRRFLRLGPALLAMLAVYLLVAPLVWPGYPHGRDALIAGLYMSDYALAIWRIPHFIGHTWSLSIEEHFYLLWPFLLPAVAKSKHPVRWLLGAYLAVTLWRFCFYWDTYLASFRFDTRASGLILGCAICFAKWKPKAELAALALLALILICAGMTPAPIGWLSITLAEISSAVLVAALANGTAGLAGKAFAIPPAVFLGRISYGIYLWHYAFVNYARQHWGHLTTLVATLAFSIVAAACSFYSVEAWGQRASGGPSIA